MDATVRIDGWHPPKGMPTTARGFLRWASQVAELVEGAEEVLAPGHTIASCAEQVRIWRSLESPQHPLSGSGVAAEQQRKSVRIGVVETLLAAGLGVEQIATAVGTPVAEVADVLSLAVEDATAVEMVAVAERMLREGSHSYAEVARVTGFHPEAVRTMAKRMGVARPTGAVVDRPENAERRAEMERLLRDGALNHVQVAQRTGFSYRQVREFARKHGYRSNHNPTKTAAPPHVREWAARQVIDQGMTHDEAVMAAHQRFGPEAELLTRNSVRHCVDYLRKQAS